jgi:hypothetical protein
MEVVIIVSSIMGGGFIAGLAGLTLFSKYIGNVLMKENDANMTRICDKLADALEADQQKNNIPLPGKIERSLTNAQ